MKRLALSLFATIMLMGSGFGVYAYSKAGDTRLAARSRRVAAQAQPAARAASMGCVR